MMNSNINDIINNAKKAKALGAQYKKVKAIAAQQILNVQKNVNLSEDDKKVLANLKAIERSVGGAIKSNNLGQLESLMSKVTEIMANGVDSKR